MEITNIDIYSGLGRATVAIAPEPNVQSPFSGNKAPGRTKKA
jgi:hypothetical protein